MIKVGYFNHDLALPGRSLNVRPVVGRFVEKRLNRTAKCAQGIAKVLKFA
jgi:hypothetical protein